MMSLGRDPASTAVIYTYGLNDDPTSRCDWVARLNCDSAKSRPPTIASTSPLELSTAIIDACTPVSCSSSACMIPSGVPPPSRTYTTSPAVRRSEEHTSELQSLRHLA